VVFENVSYFFSLKIVVGSTINLLEILHLYHYSQSHLLPNAREVGGHIHGGETNIKL
jgi:hypothetical protein